MDVAAELLLALRLSLAPFLLPSAIGKLRNPARFRQGVADYELLPQVLARRFATVLPWLELAVGAALLAGVLLPVAGSAASVLLLIFIVAIAVNLRRGRDIDCHCYGAGSTTRIGSPALLRNGILLGLAVTLTAIAALRSGLSWDSQWTLLASAPDAVLVLLFTASLIALVHLVEWGRQTRVQAARAITALRRATI